MHPDEPTPITHALIAEMQQLPRADEVDNPENVVFTASGTIHRVYLPQGTIYLFDDEEGLTDGIYYPNEGEPRILASAEIERAFQLIDEKEYDL